MLTAIAILDMAQFEIFRMIFNSIRHQKVIFIDNAIISSSMAPTLKLSCLTLGETIVTYRTTNRKNVE